MFYYIGRMCKKLKYKHYQRIMKKKERIKDEED